MSIKTYTMPDYAAEYGEYVGSLKDAGGLYYERIADGEIVVLTGDDMPARDLPASVYPGQLRSALEKLGYASDFDGAVSMALPAVKAWLQSGELLTDDPNWSGLIAANRQEQVFRLAAQL